MIGVDPDRESELMWIARAGITAPLPSGWKPVSVFSSNSHKLCLSSSSLFEIFVFCSQMDDGELYFYNFNTNQSSWEHPSDEKYRQMVREERKNSQLRQKLGGFVGPSATDAKVNEWSYAKQLFCSKVE